MAKTAPFDTHPRRYDAWFAAHETVYLSELLAVRALLPWQGLGLSVGVGTGRFAAPLGVGVGLDPSGPMLACAAERGVVCIQGVAEAIPFDPEVFDYALLVTTICFLDDAEQALGEILRVLKPGASLVIGFVDKDSELGKQYEARRFESVFYREARFYSATEVEGLLLGAGFGKLVWVQSLFKRFAQLDEIEPLREGYGSGSFVVVKAFKAP